MSKLPREVAKDINRLATSLPARVQGVPEYEPVKYDNKGNITMRRRTGKVIEGGLINHERRMKKAYYEHGNVGYLMYFDQYVKPGPLKLQIWQQIAAITGRELDSNFITQLNPLQGNEVILPPSEVETANLTNN
jgi:hypothetical protein